MLVEQYSVTVTTDDSGNATAYIPGDTDAARGNNALTGRVLALIYTKVDYASCTITVTDERSGQSIWTEASVNASKTLYPHVAATVQNGGASSLTEVPLCMARSRIKIVVASGGTTKSGIFTALIG
ncbi:MAG: hypothetical protein ABIF82_09300 [Planctomycetota bacterium]